MSQQKNRIGWIGTGVMGGPMAGHLLDAGHDLVVHNRTRPKAEPLLARGAVWADSPAAAADGAEVAFSMVGLPEDVEAVHLGPEGTLTSSRRPAVIVDMTTSRPSLAVRIHAEARSRGIQSVDAPVSGGDIGARQGTLSIMVGADPAAFDAVRPLLAPLGRSVVRQGGPGAGQHTKMVNQILIATNMIGVCEGLLYAVKAGLDPQTVIDSVGSGAAGSWSINTLGPRMVRRDFEPGFSVEHFIKDLTIALDEAGRMGLVVPGLALARQLYEATRALGGGWGGRRGTQALLLVLERLSGLIEPLPCDGRGENAGGTCPEPVD
ncbi:MAG: NAD(P)-dependent oxidoreductase [Planctomycetota bacterium]|jgi:3-hydroxyisobutyrate dehydrogenase